MKRVFAFLVLALPLLGAAPAAKSRSSQELAAVLADYDALELDQEPGVRIQRGLDVAKLPDYSYAEAQKDAEIFRAFRKRLARIDRKGSVTRSGSPVRSSTGSSPATARGPRASGTSSRSLRTPPPSDLCKRCSRTSNSGI
jgi:hypothetical protein